MTNGEKRIYHTSRSGKEITITDVRDGEVCVDTVPANHIPIGTESESSGEDRPPDLPLINPTDQADEGRHWQGDMNRREPQRRAGQNSKAVAT